MTHDLKALRELEKRIAEARGPDREMDLEIIKALRMTDPTAFYDAPNDCLAWYEPHSEVPGCPSELCGDELPRLTASLDAAVALVERLLPGAQWSVEGPKTPCATLYAEQCDDENHFAATPALALCLALVRALISQGEP